MVKTGNSILVLFSFLAILLPAVSLLIIYFKKIHVFALVQLLAIGCLLGLGESIVRIAIMDPTRQQVIHELFGTADCTLLLLLFRVTATNKLLADVFNFLLITSLSIVVTIYCITGFEKYASIIKLIQGICMILTATLALGQQVSSRDTMLFERPLFWIGGATFFYYSMLLLIEKITNTHSNPAMEAAADKNILLHLVLFVRYLFYIISMIIIQPREAAAYNSST